MVARRLLSTSVLSVGLVLLGPGVAFACGGLVAPDHAEVLRSATTLAAWHDGYEHYVTGFQFVGSADRFGYIVPLPGVPSRIQKGGEWTLERLELEVNPQVRSLVALSAEAGRASADVQVIEQVRIDALDITVVRGGGSDVAAWAERNGFDLTEDTPQVLGRYSSDGAVFALARFDRGEATKEGLIEGEGTVIHFTIPTKAPWIPLRILALGKAPSEVVDANLFVLTDGAPALDPFIGDVTGMALRRFAPADEALLADLRSDRGMGWVPTAGMWLTALRLHAPASTVDYDLSIDGGQPGPAPGIDRGVLPIPAWPMWLAGAALGALVIAMLRRDRPGVRAA